MRKIAIAFILSASTLFGQEKVVNVDACVKDTVSSPKSNFCAINLSLENDTISTKDSLQLEPNVLIDNINSKKNLAKAQNEDNAETIVEKSKEIIVNAIIGKASYYGHGDGFHGRRTASGAIFDKNDLVCAVPYNKGSKSPKYPFGTKLRVTNKDNGKSVVVTVVDTGNFGHKGRVVDLSYAAFKTIEDPRKGLTNVSVVKI